MADPFTVLVWFPQNLVLFYYVCFDTVSDVETFTVSPITFLYDLGSIFIWG